MQLPLYNFELPQEKSYDQQFNQQLLLETQQLPLAAKPTPFRVETEQQTQTPQPQQKEQIKQQKDQQQQPQKQQQIAAPSTGQPKIAYDKSTSEKSQLLKAKYSEKSVGNSKNSILS